MLNSEEKIYEVNGKKLTEAEFQELKNDPKIKLNEISPNTYKKLDKMFG